MNKLFSYIKTKKKFLSIVPIFSTFILALPKLVSADCGWSNFPQSFITGIPYYLAYSAVWLGDGATAILSWVMSDNFVKLSYTNVGAVGERFNPFVDAGLSVTQGLSNMALALILVWIGVATILRIDGYDTKKLLRNFIIMALLVNFAPLICGLAIDASNIAMNFFINKGFYDSSKSMTSQFSSILNTLCPGWDNMGTLVLASIMYILFGIATFFIMLAFALIFIIRMISLWILVVLSPIAFVFWILPSPQTKKYFTEWKQEFTEWCLMGVILSFFLFLASTGAEAIAGSYGGDSTTFLGMAQMFLVPLVIYYIALIKGMTISGAGAGIIGKIQGKTIAGAKATTTEIGRVGWRAARTSAGAMVPTRIQRTYQAARILGASPIGAAYRAIVPRAWSRRATQYAAQYATSHPRQAAAARGAAVATRGVLGAVRDVVMAGARGAGVFPKRRGLKRCPSCRRADVAASATACPTCGHIF